MVKLSSCTVFSALLLTGGVFFYFAKIGLEAQLGIDERSMDLVESQASRDKLWHLNPDKKRPLNNPQIQKTVIDAVDSSSAADVVRYDSSHLSFPSNCKLSQNLVRYWEKVSEDSFQSPLRNSSGLSAKNIQDRRYLVFQPDLGGWNNIRMGNTFCSITPC